MLNKYEKIDSNGNKTYLFDITKLQDENWKNGWKEVKEIKTESGQVINSFGFAYGETLVILPSIGTIDISKLRRGKTTFSLGDNYRIVGGNASKDNYDLTALDGYIEFILN